MIANNASHNPLGAIAADSNAMKVATVNMAIDHLALFSEIMADAEKLQSNSAINMHSGNMGSTAFANIMGQPNAHNDLDHNPNCP